MSALQAIGRIHRDLSPDNIITMRDRDTGQLTAQLIDLESVCEYSADLVESSFDSQKTVGRFLALGVA